MQLKPGSRWRSEVCDGEIVVVRPPKTAGGLECGGRPVKSFSEPRGPVLAGVGAAGAGPLVGKRYADEASGLEVLCSKSGAGLLSFDGRALVLKEAKKLPSSD